MIVSLVRERLVTLPGRKCHFQNRSVKTSTRAGGVTVRRVPTRRKLMIAGRRARGVLLIRTRVQGANTCVKTQLAMLSAEIVEMICSY